MDSDEVNIQEMNDEEYMIHLAREQAKKQLEEGTAPPSVVTYYLRLAGEMGRLEKERLRTTNELNKRKAESIRAVGESKKVAEDAVEAMRRYYRK